MTTCVVAEDEALLREALVNALADAWPELEIVAECADGGSALEAIAERQPDVAFLDIRMPGLTGLEVAAAAVSASPRTQVVFVTAYDQYAIDAFDTGAVDYLLKPIAADRLAHTVQRLRSRIASGTGDAEALAGLLQKLTVALPRKLASEPLVWLTASTGNATRLILVQDVLYFRADNKYTVVMTADGEALLRKPIKDLLEVLDPSAFKQIHRSTIVNLKAIDSITRDDTGKGYIKLKSRPETLDGEPAVHGAVSQHVIRGFSEKPRSSAHPLQDVGFHFRRLGSGFPGNVAQVLLDEEFWRLDRVRVEATCQEPAASFRSRVEVERVGGDQGRDAGVVVSPPVYAGACVRHESSP